VLDRRCSVVEGGRSSVLVVRGEAGIGKSTLLAYLARHARKDRVVRGSGVESEMELPFAGLHQLCAPLLGRLERLPGPRKGASATAFGLSTGPPPDRFLVGLAALSLLSDAAGEEPLFCLVDDARRLDEVSAQTLAFVARRLPTEPVGWVLASRGTGSPIRRSGRDSSSARTRSSGTCARCSPNSPSPLAGSSAPHSPPAPRPSRPRRQAVRRVLSARAALRSRGPPYRRRRPVTSSRPGSSAPRDPA
jgi:hypothetical protein